MSATPTTDHRLLSEFRRVFEGKPYLHRKSNHGDRVAVHLYEDLLILNKSSKYAERVKAEEHVVNTANKRRGVKSRRGDGAFGERVPGTAVKKDAGFDVARGEVANIDLGVEVKILFKSMIKQIDRVIGDVERQIEQFRFDGGDPIIVALVGINAANYCVSYERDRSYPTDGRSRRHPCQEAQAARSRIEEHISDKVDELIILEFRATNEPLYEFAWTDEGAVRAEYGAALTRLSRCLQNRFD